MTELYSSMDVGLGATKRPFFFRKKSTDEQVIKEVLVDKQYDLNRLVRTADLIGLLQRCEAKGRRPLIVDAGANIGASVIHFFAQLMPVTRPVIVAVEPHAGNFELLTRNVEGLEVHAIHGAVAAEPGKMRVIDPGSGHWGYQTEPATVADDANAVRCVTIDQIFGEHAPRAFPFIVKVDIEGAEKNLFSANTDWIRRTPLLIVETHDWLFPRRATARPFLSCIANLDRDFVSIGDDVYSIANDLDRLAAEDGS